MVGLVVATHGRLADELVATAEQIVGKLESVATCSIEPGASCEDLREKLRAAVSQVDQGDGVLVLADLFGGTPCKESLMLCREAKLEVLAGVNLPILLKASTLRHDRSMSLEQMGEQLTSYGQRNITLASALLRDAQPARIP